MGAIRKAASAVDKTARATQRTARGTTDWPFALLFGPFLDLRNRRSASEADLNVTHAGVRRRMEGATWARWISAVASCVVLVLLAAFGAHISAFFGVMFDLTLRPEAWLFAPLIPVAWAVLTRRAAWWKGQPTLSRMLSPGAWFVAALSLIPPTVIVYELLFEPFDSELRGWLVYGSAWLAVIVGFFSALSVAHTLKSPRQTVVDGSDAQLIVGITGMSEAQYAKGILSDKVTGKPTFVVGREGDQLRAVLPVGLDKLLEDRAGIEQRLAVRAPDWEVGSINLTERSLALVPVSDETTMQREARAASGGFTGTAINRESRVVVDSGIAWDSPAP